MENNPNADDFSSRTIEIAAALTGGDIERAVRSSGELLAVCDNTLRELHNAGQPVGEAMQRFVEAAILHIHALRTANAPSDAFSCAIGALLTVEIYQAGAVIDSARKLRLYSYAVCSVIDCFDAMGDANDSNDEDHRGFILSYLASLLYYYYRVTAETEPDDPSLGEAYRFLSAIKDSGAIQTPTIKLGEQEVDPANSGPLLVDIMSRAAALGIYA